MRACVRVGACVRECVRVCLCAWDVDIYECALCIHTTSTFWSRTSQLKSYHTFGASSSSSEIPTTIRFHQFIRLCCCCVFLLSSSLFLLLFLMLLLLLLLLNRCFFIFYPLSFSHAFSLATCTLARTHIHSRIRSLCLLLSLFGCIHVFRYYYYTIFSSFARSLYIFIVCKLSF